MPEISLDNLSSQEQIDDFEKKSNQGLWMKRYHADWCSHCQKMNSEWQKFVNSDNQGIQIASIEDKAVQKMRTRPSNLLGFPSIHIYKNGTFISEFEGERTSQKISDFLKTFISTQSGGGYSKKKKHKKNKFRSTKRTLSKKSKKKN